MSQTLRLPVHSELLIRKSRFIGRVEPIADRTAAQARVADLRAQHPGAAHVCWALMAGGQSAAVDDGEPSGTAGRPMLEVLRHHDLEGVLATVVRYFGGVKLGAGGLVRAYTDAVAQALKDADYVPRLHYVDLACELPYALEGWLRRELSRIEVRDLEVVHGAEVGFRFSLPEGEVGGLRQRLDEGGQGKLRWQEVSPPDPSRPAGRSGRSRR